MDRTSLHGSAVGRRDPLHTGQVVHPKNPPPVCALLYVIVLPHNGQLNVVVLGPSAVVLVLVLALAWGTVTATGHHRICNGSESCTICNGTETSFFYSLCFLNQVRELLGRHCVGEVDWVELWSILVVNIWTMPVGVVILVGAWSA